MVPDSDYNVPYIIVESIINRILFFNDFSGSHIKYFVLICELCKSFKDIFNTVLKQAIESIFNNLEHMNAACFQRFVDFFVFYANFLNCSFSWEIFLVDVKKNEPLAKLIKKINLPSPELHFRISKGDSEMDVVQSFVRCIKAKTSIPDIIKELEQFSGNPNLKFVFVLVQTILKGGFQTPTHTAHVIDKYLPILKHFIVTEEDNKACIEAAYDAWQKNLAKVKHVIQLLEQRKVIDPLAIVSGFLTLELESMRTNLLSWEVVSAQVSLLACKFTRLRDNYRNLKMSLKEKVDEDSADETSKQLSNAKKEKDNVKEERIKLLYLIVTKIFDSISLLTKTPDYKKNFEFFYHSQSLLQSIIEYSNNDEHVIEIINRFQTIYT
ncbi:hypothetical protein MXB_5389 [Myxobolus squamalis]|nr:hypothetical protein MXB_5389 [Myxobolus squamalis]